MDKTGVDIFFFFNVLTLTEKQISFPEFFLPRATLTAATLLSTEVLKQKN